jgi:hypothetical protein
VAALDTPVSLGFSLQPDLPSTDTASVAVRHTGSTMLPRGFSAGRFALHQFEIESTGHAARGISMSQVQGVARALPAEVPTTTEGSP